jgi:hypothetical protein
VQIHFCTITFILRVAKSGHEEDDDDDDDDDDRLTGWVNER